MAARSTPSPAVTIPLWILAVLATLFFLRAGRTLLIPIALAALISYALMPVVTWLEKRRVPRLAGAGLVLLLILGACGAGVYALRDDARHLLEMAPKGIERAREMVQAHLGSAGGAAQQGASGSQPTSGEAAPLLQRAAGAVASVAGHLVVIFFLVYFLLIFSHQVRQRIIEVSGRDAEERRVAAAIIDEINAQIQRYLLVLLVTGAVVGVATWLVLVWIGVRNAAMWGILAGVFNSIPYFGPVIVSGGLFIVGMVQGGGLTQAIQMAGAAIVITSLEGWLLAPPLMGKAERMSALAVFLGLLLWTWLWGGWGTVLAVPMLVILKSVADRVEPLRPVGRLMAP
jgi:predicted PurR-regulated permease PerM